MAPAITNDDDEDLSRLSNEQSYYINSNNNNKSNNTLTQSCKFNCSCTTSDQNDSKVENPIGFKASDIIIKQNNDQFVLSQQTKETQTIDQKSKIFDPQAFSIANYGATNNKTGSRSKRVSRSLSKKLSGVTCSFGGANRDSVITNGQDPEKAGSNSICIADIIGSFGWFQLLVLLFSGLREGLVGYDALVMSIILQPESKFLCADNLRMANKLDDESTSISHNRHTNLANFSALFPGQYDGDHKLNETAQCYLSLDGGNSFLIDPKTNEPSKCHSWIFSNESSESGGPSLVAEWSLVCQYHWLIFFIESVYFFGLVTGNLIWGYYADKVGRRPAYLAAHTISLVFGSLAVVSPTIYTFAFCRYLSAFGSIGYNIIYSIQVELIGVRHRSFCTIINHLGWGLGVICVPLADHLFDDYRPIIAIAPVLSLLMFPWAFWLPESSRWLIANDRFYEARRELIRAATFNGKKITPKLEKAISALMHKAHFDKDKEANEQTYNELTISSGGAPGCNVNVGDNNDPHAKHIKQTSGANEKVNSYKLIFTNRKLLRDTLILSYVAFVGHLFYYVQTINFAYVKNLSTAANFITSGAGEWVSVVVGAILLGFFSRRTCMAVFLFFMACSFTFQSFVDSEIIPELDTKLIITANNGVGTLASLLLVFVALIVNQEVFPTIVRQTGTSLTNTLGESGSTLAPLVIQFSRIIGAWRANVIYSVFCLFGILATQFISKTDDIELPDT